MTDNPVAKSIVQAPGGLLAGATYPFRALGLLSSTPALWGYVLMPMLVNLVIGIALYLGLILPGFHAIESLVANLPGWLAILELLLRVVLGILLLVGTGFLLMQFGSILGSPWYGALSERLEQLRLSQPPPEGTAGLGAAIQDIGRSLMFELKKLCLAVAVGVLLFLLGWIPVVGPVVLSFGGIALAAMLVCLDCLDPCLERRRLSFRHKLSVLRRALPASASFGFTCLAIVSVPLLNLVTIPICIAAGTLFFCDRIFPTWPSTP